MFGKARWFRQTASGVKLAPVTWQGWVYVAAWGAVLALPGMILLGDGKLGEMLVWLAATGGLAWWDAKLLRDTLVAESPNPAPEDDVLVIDENETESERFATRHYDLRFRNR